MDADARHHEPLLARIVVQRRDGAVVRAGVQRGRQLGAGAARAVDDHRHIMFGRHQAGAREQHSAREQARTEQQHQRQQAIDGQRASRQAAANFQETVNADHGHQGHDDAAHDRQHHALIHVAQDIPVQAQRGKGKHAGAAGDNREQDVVIVKKEQFEAQPKR
ncbi:hypothetical protein D3C71_956310 [compost metagenome]